MTVPLLRSGRGQWCVMLRGWVLLPILVTTLAGCGGQEQEGGLVPVKGRVTLDGGSWPQPGYITFVPQDEETTFPSASTAFDKEGNFRVIGGYGEAEGLHPGSYWVSVDCPEDPGAMPEPGKSEEPKNYAPAKYRRPETSGFSLDVSADEGTVEKTFEVKTSG